MVTKVKLFWTFNKFSQQCRSIIRNNYLNVAITRILPFRLGTSKIFKTGMFCSEVLILLYVKLLLIEKVALLDTFNCQWYPFHIPPVGNLFYTQSCKIPTLFNTFSLRDTLWRQSLNLQKASQCFMTPHKKLCKIYFSSFLFGQMSIKLKLKSMFLLCIFLVIWG